VKCSERADKNAPFRKVVLCVRIICFSVNSTGNARRVQNWQFHDSFVIHSLKANTAHFSEFRRNGDRMTSSRDGVISE